MKTEVLSSTGDVLDPIANPLAREWSKDSVRDRRTSIQSDALTCRLPGGMVYRIAPSLDSRCKFVIDGVVFAKTEAFAEELYNEAKTWGVTGVRFAVG